MPRKAASEPVAGPGTTGLFKVAESLAGEKGNRENPPGDQEEPAVWFGEMGGQSGSTVRVGKHHAEALGGLKKAPDPFSPGVNTYADYCLVYNYFSSWTAPSSCPTTPTPPSSGTGNNGNVTGYFYQDGVNTGFGHTMKYTYDNVNRLTEDQTTSGPSLTQLYSYIGDLSNGQFGNMTCTSGCANMPVNLAFNVANNQINSPTYMDITERSAPPTNGREQLNPSTHQWDAEGRVWSVVNGATTTWSFTYDANGDRVAWVSGGVTYDHLFDPAGNWPLGVAGSYSIAMLGIRPLTIYTSGETWFHHLNNIGSRTMMTAHWGNVTQDMVFYPFGGLWQNSGSGGLEFADLPYRDTTTNIDLTMFRLSSPNLGRWHSPDPLGGGMLPIQPLNRYAYVLNNPTGLIHLLGLDPCTSSNTGPVELRQADPAGLPVEPRRTVGANL